MKLAGLDEEGPIEPGPHRQKAGIAVGLDQKPARTKRGRQRRNEVAVQIEKDGDQVVAVSRETPARKVGLDQVEKKPAPQCLGPCAGQGDATSVDGVYAIAERGQVESVATKTASYVQGPSALEEMGVLAQELTKEGGGCPGLWPGMNPPRLPSCDQLNREVDYWHDSQANKPYSL